MLFRNMLSRGEQFLVPNISISGRVIFVDMDVSTPKLGTLKIPGPY